jgi:hypothetical protein
VGASPRRSDSAARTATQRARGGHAACSGACVSSGATTHRKSARSEGAEKAEFGFTVQEIRCRRLWFRALEVWGLGFGVLGLGFGVWGLGFGVWGLGFWVFDYL